MEGGNLILNREKETKKIGIPGVIAIMLASSLTVMVGNAITPALPELGAVYGLGNYASWLVTAPALGVTATALLFGKLIDKKGPYHTAFFGLLFYGVLGVAGAFMPNAAAIFVDRFFLGAATAAIMSASVALITVFFDGEKQLRMIALQGMSMELGGVIFLSISGVLAGFSWRYPFFIYALGLAAFLMLVLFVPRCKKAVENTEDDDGSFQKQGTPVSLVLLIAFFGMLMFFTAMVSLPIYLQNDLGYSPSFTGYYLAALDLVAVLSAGAMPRIVAKLNEKGCLLVAFSCYGAAFFIYFLSGHTAALWTAVLLAGAGFGLSTPLFNSLVVRKSAPGKKGTNISLCTMAMFLGQFLSALLVSTFSGRNLFIAAAVISWIIGACIIPVTRVFEKRSL